MQKISRLSTVRLLCAATFLAPLVLLASPALREDGYLTRPQVRSFIEEMSAEHRFERTELQRILGEAQHQPAVVRLIGPAPQKTAQPVRSYPAYRAKFLNERRIGAGTKFWETYDEHLRRAETEFGVPAEVILGILGVETAFGQNTGSFRIVDALATIAFDGPRRQEYFRGELKEFLLLTREIGADPLVFRGSYAGAMGLPQFMPSSYRRYAVDFDHDGRIDLVGSPVDAIGSVARYLKAFGWTAGEAWRVPVRLPSGGEKELLSGLQRIHSIADLKDKGVKFTSSALPEGACSVIELPTPGKPSKYLAGFANFEAITRYNRSTFYATAVLDLAEAILVARTSQLTATAELHPPPAT